MTNAFIQSNLLDSAYSFLLVHAFLVNRTHDLYVANTMLLFELQER